MEHPGGPLSRTPATGHRVSRATRRARTTALARWYAGLGRRGQAAVEAGLTSLLPPLLGFVAYVAIGASPAAPLLEVWFWVLFVALVATSAMIALECARALRFPEPPLSAPPARLPRLATVVAAYLPNEVDTLLDSVRHHLALEYSEQRHVVVVACNGPADHPLLDDLHRLAARERRLLVLHVSGSTSKVQNLTAALEVLGDRVEVIGIFDADHHPHPRAGQRAAQWLSDEAGERRFDVVQGQCVVRNGDESLVSGLVEAEFATLYAVAHPGRTVVNDFGLFGGSNGWWRAEVLRELGLDASMLTEDIDVSARALDGGRRLGTDPRILSHELAPTTWSAWWRQRTRWAQGWHEVSMRHFARLLFGRRLSAVQRRGVFLLFGWRVLHPLLAPQLLPLVVAMAVATDARIVWTLLFFMVAAACVNGVPLLQAVTAKRLAPPGLRERRWTFARFVLCSVLFYAELRMVVTRGAVVRHLLGAHTWDVTTRTVHPDRTASGAAAGDEAGLPDRVSA